MQHPVAIRAGRYQVSDSNRGRCLLPTSEWFKMMNVNEVAAPVLVLLAKGEAANEAAQPMVPEARVASPTVPFVDVPGDLTAGP